MAADVLWGDKLPDGWSLALSSLTSKIRKLLDEVGVGRESLVSSSGTLELVLPADCWVDLEAATRHLDMAIASLSSGTCTDALPDATAAWSILQRPFLPGLDNAWADATRRKLDRQRYTSCEILSRAWLANGDPRLALTSAESAIALDPLREQGYQLAIQASLGLADRALARQIYEECSKTLSAELGIGPSAETTALLR